MRLAGGRPPLRRIALGGPKDARGIVDADALLLLFLACGALAALLTVGDALREKPPDRDAASEDRERAQLRIKAQFDRRAAIELRGRLRDDLKRHEAVRRHLQHDKGSDPDLPVLMQAVESADQSARQQLAEVETWLARGG